jgi:hypothetical protein
LRKHRSRLLKSTFATREWSVRLQSPKANLLYSEKSFWSSVGIALKVKLTHTDFPELRNSKSFRLDCAQILSCIQLVWLPPVQAVIVIAASYLFCAVVRRCEIRYAAQQKLFLLHEAIDGALSSWTPSKLCRSGSWQLIPSE